MSPSAAIRWGGGLTSVAAGLLLLLGHIVNLGGGPEYGTVLGEILVLGAHALLVFALVSLWAIQAERSGPLGAVGMVLSVVGTTHSESNSSGNLPATRFSGMSGTRMSRTRRVMAMAKTPSLRLTMRSLSLPASGLLHCAVALMGLPPGLGVRRP